MAVVEVGGESYHIDNRLKDKWDKIKGGILAKYDEDRVYMVDGREGSGKSVFTLQSGAYIDPTIVDDLDRITFDADEFLEAIRKTRSNKKETKVVIFDEAFRGISSKSALSKTNRYIIQALMEMREKNLVVFIVSPSFYLIELYASMIRSHALFHIMKKKNSRVRSYKIYSYQKKARLYQEGIKKGWSYKLPTTFRGRFPGKYPGGKEFEVKYRAKKREAGLKSSKDLEKKEVESKFVIQRDIFAVNLYHAMKKYEKWTRNKFMDELNGGTNGLVSFDPTNLSKLMNKVGKMGEIVLNA